VKYQPLQPISTEEALRELASGDESRMGQALIRIGLFVEDDAFLLEACST
jgi:hypothetical protein